MGTFKDNSDTSPISENAVSNFIKGFIIIILFIVGQSIFAQVGVGTTNPQATLDITIADPDNPLNTDGILVPRVNTLTFTGLSTFQNGMLVYLTTDVTLSSVLYPKGFYYWDDGTSSWLLLNITDTNTTYDGSNFALSNQILPAGQFVVGVSAAGTLISATPPSGSDDQNISGSGLSGTNLTIGIENGTNQVIDLSSLDQSTEVFNNANDIINNENSITNNNNIINNHIGIDADTAIGNESLTAATLSGSTLQITESGTTTNVNLSSLQDGTGTDNQNITGSGLSGTDLTIGIQNGTSQVVDLSSLQDGIGTDNQNITGSGLTGTDLTIGIQNGTSQVVDLSSLQDGIGTDNQNITGSGLSGTNLTIGIQNGTSQVVDLSTLQDGTGTDEQTIDNFSFNTSTNELTLEIENDGIPAQTVDLSSLSASDTDWFEQGTSTLPNSINDDIYTLGGVKIGYTNGTSNDAKLGINSTNETAGVLLFNDVLNTITTPKYGVYVQTDILNGSSGNYQGFTSSISTSNPVSGYITNYRATNNVSSLNTSNDNHFLFVGEYNNNSGGSSSASRFGSYISFSTNVTNTGNKYGHYTVIPSSVPGQHYGNYSDVEGANNFAAYFIGRTSLGIGTANRYLMPETAGTTNQIMSINNSGQVNFVDVSTIITDSDEQTIDNFSFNTATNELTLEIENDGVAVQTVDLSSLISGNTLDEAYNQGGAGAGRIIDATDGAMTIAGEDGFLVTGTYGSGDDILISGTGTRMFFNPKKSAFRSGRVIGNIWNDINVGLYSVAFGVNTEASGGNSTAIGGSTVASGDYSTAIGFQTEASGSVSTAIGRNTIASGHDSTAMGYDTEASGNYSTSMGFSTLAPSYIETSIGHYNTTYTPSSSTTINNTDRVFSIGNGTSTSRSNALTIYKSGLMNINDEYNMPLTDGTTNQIMATNGIGQVNFVDVNSIFTDSDTDDQTIDTFSFNTSTNVITLEIEDDGIAAQTVDLSSLNNANTLDEAYDEGGAGAGRTITVDNGAVVIQGDAGSATATTSAQLILTETQANDYSRLRLTNSVETDNIWTIATRTDNTASVSRMNFNHTGIGDLFQLWGDGFVEVNGTLEVDGQIGINVNNPTFAIELPNSALDGTGRGRAQSWQTYSDTRIKKQQNTLTYGLKELLRITPKSYIQYNSEFVNGRLILHEDYQDKTIGFIAQELYTIIPEAVTKPKNESTDLWSVDYQKIIPVTVKAIQDLHKTVASLEEENAILKAKLDKLETLEVRLSALENKTELIQPIEIVSKEE